MEDATTTRSSGDRVLTCAADLVGASRLLRMHAARTTRTARALRLRTGAAPRSSHARWIGGASGDGTDPRARIRSKLANGTLPRADSVASITTWGTGRSCSACDVAIAVGHRALLATYLDGAVLRFHVVCFGAWEVERQATPRPAA